LVRLADAVSDVLRMSSLDSDIHERRFFGGRLGDNSNASIEFENRDQELLRKLERATGIEPEIPAWECSRVSLCFQHLQKHLGKLPVHSVHHVPWTALFADRCGTFVGQKIPVDSLFEIRARSSKSSQVAIDRYESTVRAKNRRALTNNGAHLNCIAYARRRGKSTPLPRLTYAAQTN
jgi:hypothetical protein